MFGIIFVSVLIHIYYPVPEEHKTEKQKNTKPPAEINRAWMLKIRVANVRPSATIASSVFSFFFILRT